MIKRGENILLHHRRLVILFIVFLCISPLLLPTFPPLTDLPGHMGRYRVALDISTDPILQQFYSFDWALIGNLGVDLLVMPLAKIFDLEFSVKLIVIAIVALQAGAILTLSKMAHGKVMPSALLALPFIYSFAFHSGFLNFSLSVACALWSLIIWIRWAHRFGIIGRLPLAIPLSTITWFASSFGWALLGLMIFGYQLSLELKENTPTKAILAAALKTAPFALPALTLLFAPPPGSGLSTGHWFSLHFKQMWIFGALRDRWPLFDSLSMVFVISTLCLLAMRRQMQWSKPYLFIAALLAIAFVVVPYIVSGLAYMDMRIVPVMFIFAILAIGKPVNPENAMTKYLVLCVAFFAIRLAGNFSSYLLYDQEIKNELEALAVIPDHAKLVNFVNFHYPATRSMARNYQLGSMALVRKRAYSNSQWVISGAHTIRSRINAEGYEGDPSQLVVADQGPGRADDGLLAEIPSISTKLAGLPAGKFDYLWLIDVEPSSEGATTDMTLVWKRGKSSVYRLNKAD